MLAFSRTMSKFLLVGALSTIIEISVLNLMLYAFGWSSISWGPVAAKTLASSVALVNAYFGNREWAFRDRDRRSRRSEIFWFLFVNLFCLILGSLLFWVGIELGAWILDRTLGPAGVNIVNLGSIALVVLVRFTMYHLLVFRAPKPRD